MSSETFSSWMWRVGALVILTCYPIMAIKWIPFGGGARYLSVLVPPVCLILLYRVPRSELKSWLMSAGRWGLPFVPFVAAWTLAQVWHGYHPLDSNPLSRLLLCALLFVGARLAGLNYRHLAIVAGIGAIVYCAVAVGEVYWQGRERAWGGTYENRFGQFAMWLSALCFLHAVIEKQKLEFRLFLLLAGVGGLFATLLSGARGALVALPILMLVILAKSNNWRRGLLVVAVAAFAALAFLYLYTPIHPRLELTYREFTGYFTETQFTPTSIGIRLELFRIAYLVLLDSPLIGPGYLSLQQLYETHPALGAPLPEMLHIPGFHNDWAQAVGIGGGLMLSALLATCTWLWLDSRKSAYRRNFLGFALVFGLSEIFFANKLGLSLLMVCWALYSAAEQNEQGSA